MLSMPKGPPDRANHPNRQVGSPPGLGVRGRRGEWRHAPELRTWWWRLRPDGEEAGAFCVRAPASPPCACQHQVQIHDLGIDRLAFTVRHGHGTPRPTSRGASPVSDDDPGATTRRRKKPKPKPHVVGPEGERQPRLPGLGTGHFGGGSAAFEPENWQERPPGGGRIAAFHSSMEMTLPATDDPFQARGADWDDNRDVQGRPMASFGSAIGLHLGSLKAAENAGFTREYIHPVSIPRENITTPQDAPEEALQPWAYHSGSSHAADGPGR